MKTTPWTIACLLTLGATSQLLGGEPLLKLPHWLGCWPDCVGRFCCDDYRSKPLPCLHRGVCLECDDYCRKPLPCAQPIKPLCFSDYCPKPLPWTCRLPSKELRCLPDPSLPKYTHGGDNR